MGYHPCSIGFLTSRRDPAVGQCQTGSLTGAVASERVSEAPKGSLRMDGNHSKSAKAEGSLTATPTGGAGTKVGLSDPVVLSGNAIAQRIKATLIKVDNAYESLAKLLTLYEMSKPKKTGIDPLAYVARVPHPKFKKIVKRCSVGINKADLFLDSAYPAAPTSFRNYGSIASGACC